MVSVKSRPDSCPRCGESCTSHTGNYCHKCGEVLAVPNNHPPYDRESAYDRYNRNNKSNY